LFRWTERTLGLYGVLVLSAAVATPLLAAAFVGGERFQRGRREVLAHVADICFQFIERDVVAYRVFRNFRLGIRISSVCVIIFCGIL
jgi:hypothetical protein